MEGTKIEAFCLTSGPKFYKRISYRLRRLDIREDYLLAREVDTHGTLTEKAGIELVGVTGNTTDDRVAQRSHILQRLALQVVNLMPALLQTLTASESLDAGDVDTVDAGTVVGQQGGERASDDLGAVDDTDGAAEETVSIRQYRVVDVEVFEDLDNGEGRAGQDTLLALRLGVQEPDVLVHVEDVAMAQALDILGYVDNLLEVLVLAVVEDGVVYDDTVNVRVDVGGEDGFFEVIAVDFTERVTESTVRRSNYISYETRVQ
jgi:hypothetical protein